MSSDSYAIAIADQLKEALVASKHDKDLLLTANL